MSIEVNSQDRDIHIAILMATFNGEKHIKEQLDSIFSQTYKHYSIYVSDDGSVDDTISILEEYKTSHPEISFYIYAGPRKGFAQNFLSLLLNSGIEADLYAFCDQDDIWEVDKLARAVAFFKSKWSNIPMLYCGRTRLISEDGSEIGFSPLFEKKPGFQNALVQSIAGGNTMIMNSCACDVLRKAGMQKIVSHDWWAYMLITGVGGIVFYDQHPSIHYRQHDDNLVGSNNGLSASMYRIKMLLKGRFRKWNDSNYQSLENCLDMLTNQNQCILEELKQSREYSLIPRIRGFHKSGVYRQSFIGNIGLFAASLFNKL